MSEEASEAAMLVKVPAKWRKALCSEAARRNELRDKSTTIDDLVLEAVEAYFQALKPQE